MTRNKLIESLLVASLATLAATAGAQNAAPREPTPGQVQPQNGSPVGTTEPAINPQYNANSPYSQPMPGSQAGLFDDQVQAYLDARQACASQPLLQQGACNDDVNSRFSSVDMKCQKLSGQALVDCVHGADRGG